MHLYALILAYIVIVFNFVGKEEVVYQLFKNIPDLTVYKREELPPELHYGKNRRVLTLVLTAPEGVRFCPSPETQWCNLTG